MKTLLPFKSPNNGQLLDHFNNTVLAKQKQDNKTTTKPDKLKVRSISTKRKKEEKKCSFYYSNVQNKQTNKQMIGKREREQQNAAVTLA